MSAPATAGDSGGAVLDALPSPLDSVADSREAARWTLASAGAVGALLLGGGPLLAVGRIGDWTHALWAGGGLLLALIGIAWAMWQTSEVLVPPLTTPAVLASPALRGLREQLDAAPGYYFGSLATDVEGLLRHRRIALEISRRLPTADAAERAVLERGLATAHRNIARTDPYLRWLLATAHAWIVREKLRKARRHTFLSAVLVITGAVVFLVPTGR
ncbi:hypothetical protein PUR59_35585 [Streptomyces sp. SP18ES09]|uniref:hypothetical protein n=1 Tax=Streptomyces sp. SP18ES09 TaxID=3002532 RepID=UPI002E77FD35|nr:hypothetical protein [Streptomyces sp. SP18ES09]MEE1820323.1 hypothetical protein [Streptomyces sp. SP18ES09]